MSSRNIQTVELTEILQACRKLSNTLDLEQLYMVLANVIRKKFRFTGWRYFFIATKQMRLSLFSMKV